MICDVGSSWKSSPLLHIYDMVWYILDDRAQSCLDTIEAFRAGKCDRTGYMSKADLDWKSPCKLSKSLYYKNGIQRTDENEVTIEPDGYQGKKKD